MPSLQGAAGTFTTTVYPGGVMVLMTSNAARAYRLLHPWERWGLVSAAVCMSGIVLSWFAGPAIASVPWTVASTTIALVIMTCHVLAIPLVIIGAVVLLRWSAAMMFLPEEH